MSRVDLVVVLRHDPDEPTNRSGVALIEDVGGRPVVVVSDLLRVDELALGHVVAMLLTAATQDEPATSGDSLLSLLDADTDRGQP